MVEATAASTSMRRASQPMAESTAIVQPDPLLPLCSLTPSNAAAAFGDDDDNDVAQSCLPSGPVPPPSYSMFGVHSDLVRLTPASSVPLEELGLTHSLARLEAESHTMRLRQLRAVQNDSQTGPSYARHLTHYQVWWEPDQAVCCAREPGFTPIPHFPVTAAKVAMFLEYETTREKVGPPLRDTNMLSMCLLMHATFSSASMETQPRQSLDRQSGVHLSCRPSVRSRNGAPTTTTYTWTTQRLRLASERTTASRPSRLLPDKMSQAGLRAHRSSKQQAPLQVCHAVWFGPAAFILTLVLPQTPTLLMSLCTAPSGA
jgi:hypothetical protein